MSPLSPAVLGGAAVVASPALWAGVVDGSMPLDVALTRYLIAIGICWAVLSVIVELAFTGGGPPRPVPAETSSESAQQDQAEAS